MTRQRWWSPKHRSSSPDNGVDALTEVHEATPGFAARYGLRDCARPFRRARQGTWCSGLPRTPPSSYPGALPAPGAGLSPASSRVSTAYCPVPFLRYLSLFKTNVELAAKLLRVIWGVWRSGRPYTGGGAGAPAA
jgi:hypothetical protein